MILLVWAQIFYFSLFANQMNFKELNRDFFLDSDEQSEFCPDGRFYYNSKLNRFFLGASVTFAGEFNKKITEKNADGCIEEIETSIKDQQIEKRTLLYQCDLDKNSNKKKTEIFGFDSKIKKYFFEREDFLGKKTKCFYK